MDAESAAELVDGSPPGTRPPGPRFRLVEATLHLLGSPNRDERPCGNGRDESFEAFLLVNAVRPTSHHLHQVTQSLVLERSTLQPYG